MERYKISPAQIYSITCDNAINMVKMVDLFNENSENNDEPVDDTDEENISTWKTVVILKLNIYCINY